VGLLVCVRVAGAQTFEADRASLLIQEKQLESAIDLIRLQIAALKAREASYQALRACLAEKINENGSAGNVIGLELEYMHSSKDSWTTGGQIENEALPDADINLSEARARVASLERDFEELRQNADAAYLAVARLEASLRKGP
jgi:hypothetical protein